MGPTRRDFVGAGLLALVLLLSVLLLVSAAVPA